MDPAPQIRRIYIAGPFSSDPEGNTRRALDAANHLRRNGHHPFVPHVACDWAALAGGYEAAMVECLAWLPLCDALVRIPGESPGADREVARARQLGIPVYFGVEEAIAHAPR